MFHLEANATINFFFFCFLQQFFTCRDNTAPNDILQLMKEHWLLSLPKVVISVHGDFPKRDYSWKTVMNESIIFTTGSSPSQQKLDNSSTIAIMDINRVYKNEALFCKSSNQVSFCFDTFNCVLLFYQLHVLLT